MLTVNGKDLSLNCEWQGPVPKFPKFLADIPAQL